MTEKEMKDWIDNASYESLLKKWRFTSVSDAFFQGVTGEYYKTVMFKKRDEIGNAAHVRASKAVGW